MQPTKKIRDDGSLKQFHASACGLDLIMFIVETQKSVKGIKMSDTALPAHIEPLYNYLDKLNTLLDQVPPIQQPMRFGNKAFKTWVAKMAETVDDDLLEVITKGNPNFKHPKRPILELKEYILESFGHNERMDYGTGHELNFLIFLYCMCKIGVYTVNDYAPLINKVFQRYLLLMRRI